MMKREIVIYDKTKYEEQLIEEGDVVEEEENS